ncbi:MAG: hypothetical protein E6J14_06195 [Chloroflexi bacterium]|nr:MAG: hypothetical protein E6J14_06195 [Chloroflexota bacterium]
MLAQPAFEATVTARLEDFFRPGTPWNRRLWSLGLILSLDEVLEVSRAVAERVVWSKSLDLLKKAVTLAAQNDAGLGTGPHLAALRTCLKQPIAPGGFGYQHLKELAANISVDYLDNWAAAIQISPKPYPERVARAIAAHLLDTGYSQQYLVAWLGKLTRGNTTVVDMIASAQELLRNAARHYEVLIPLVARPDPTQPLPQAWRDAQRASEWLQRYASTSPPVRQSGAFLFTIEDARDPYAAAERATEMIAGMDARVRLGPSKAMPLLGKCWVKGVGHSLPLRREWAVEIEAIAKTRTVYKIDPDSRVDGALDLLSTFNSGPPGAAVSAAWAAIESLLIGPGDDDRGLAAVRCADIVLCSLPRAELTALVHSHIDGAPSSDPLAAQLRGDLRAGHGHREAVRSLEEALRAGVELYLPTQSDQAAYQRLMRMINQPDTAFPAIRRHLIAALRRLFRQRNIALHSGRVQTVMLRPALRAAAPVVAQGMNMMAYAWLRTSPEQPEPIDPIELAARARARLDLIETHSSLLHDLLGYG